MVAILDLITLNKQRSSVARQRAGDLMRYVAYEMAA